MIFDKTFIRFCISILFLFYSLVSTAATLQNKNMELNQVATQIKALRQTILIDKQQQENLQQELQSVEVTIGQLSQQEHRLNKIITKEQLKLNHLKNAQKMVLKRLSQQQIGLDQQIRSAYQLSQLHPLKIILNENNPNTIQRHLTYYYHLTEARLKLIKTIKHSLLSLKSNMQEIVKHQNNLKKLLTEKKSQHIEEQQAQNHRHHLLNHIKQSVESKEQQLTTLVANQKALADIISQLQVKAELTPSALPFNQQHGKLNWPVVGNIIANYGSSLDVGDQHLNGVIIHANQGTPVHAIYAGKVIFANWLRGFGLLIIINHDNNFMSLYGRNHAVLAQVGTHVNTGDVIATTGSSGGFDNPGLYFEIRKNGAPVNPNIWCR